LVAEDDHADLLAQVAAVPDATLADHAVRWEAEQGVRLSVATMGRALRRAGVTLKKRP